MKKCQKRILTYCILIQILFFSSSALTAQQTAFYGLYQKNWQIINPAALNLAILQDNAENTLNLSYRQQWIGLKGSPANYNVNFETMLQDNREMFNMKFGGGLYGESAGAMLNNTAYINYAFPLTLDFSNSRFVKTHKLYLGFNAGYLHQRINFNAIRFESGVDETVSNIIREQKLIGGQGFFEFTPGLFYTNPENFYVGLSSPRLLTAGKLNGATKVINAKPQIHLIAGFYNEDRTIQPSIWVRWQSTIDYQSLIAKNPVSATLNFKSKINDNLTLGLGASTGRWVHFEGGWQIGTTNSINSYKKPIQISFSYDLPFYKTGLNLGQTGEINFVFFL